MVQRRFVAFVFLRLVLFGGFRGDVGAVHQVFKSPGLRTRMRNIGVGIRRTYAHVPLDQQYQPELLDILKYHQ